MKIDQGKTKYGMQQVLTIVCVTHCAKIFLDSNFNQTDTDKLSIFHEIGSNF